MIAFGPIPSRRLGQSLGINNIPPKTCSYECVYCQVGPTTVHTMQRRAFYDPEELCRAVREKIAEVRTAGASIDYLTIVPDGEPTLDIHLGRIVDLLRPLGIKIAVITNASLLWQKEVKKILRKVDWLSLKVDSATEEIWRRINRPANGLSLEKIKEGILSFVPGFEGELSTETLLVKGVNDHRAELTATAEFISLVDPDIAYIGIPTRPPLKSWVKAPDESALNEAYQIFATRLKRVECLFGFPEGDFSVTGEVTHDILDITAVHPMREIEALSFLERGGAGRAELDALVKDGRLRCVEHEGQRFYIRKLEN